MAKFRIASYYTFRDMNYFLLFFGPVQSTEYRVQTESDAYEPTVQLAQVGSKIAAADKWGSQNLDPL